MRSCRVRIVGNRDLALKIRETLFTYFSIKAEHTTPINGIPKNIAVHLSKDQPSPDDVTIYLSIKGVAQ